MVAPGATITFVVNPGDGAVRTFKTAWFAKAARKAHITDEELCSAIQQVRDKDWMEICNGGQT